MTKDLTSLITSETLWWMLSNIKAPKSIKSSLKRLEFLSSKKQNVQVNVFIYISIYTCQVKYPQTGKDKHLSSILVSTCS